MSNSFYKDYPNRKDWRKPYRGAKAICGGCRNHGSCQWCQDTRTYNNRKREIIAKEKLVEA